MTMNATLRKVACALLAILILSGGGAAMNARADVSAYVYDAISGDHFDNNSGWPTDFQFFYYTNLTFGVFDTFQVSRNFNYGGAFGYYDVERRIMDGYVYHTLRVAGTAINSQYADVSFNRDGSIASGFESEADSSATAQLTEDMMIEYLPDSVTDTPPTSVSFQASYLIQGGLSGHDWNYGAQPGNVDVADSTLGEPAPLATLFSPPIALSTNIVSNSNVIVGNETTATLNTIFQYEDYIGGGADWDNITWVAAPDPVNDYEVNYTVPCAYDLRYIFQGFVNMVDQNNQPIPPNKLKFLCVNPNDTAQQVQFASQPDQTTEQAIWLTAVPGTNSIVLQWPSYAGNYQLETAASLASAYWNTNSLPAPVVSGPFLQVTVPATNAAAFFRLIQSN